MRFPDLSLGETVPDAKTIWLFRDTLVKADVMRELFDVFGRQLEMQGIIKHSGSIVDATFVGTPRQRNTREENQQMEEGAMPQDLEKPENIQ